MSDNSADTAIQICQASVVPELDQYTLDQFENKVLLGDCLDELRKIPTAVFDSVVVDPPYGLGTKEPTVDEIIAYLGGSELDTNGDFMGAKWSVPSVDVWREVYRVLKPGGHVLCFGGTRTFDLISLGLRAAGFENRDTIAGISSGLLWVQGQGMPKSHNVSKAIDKKKGAKRKVVGVKSDPRYLSPRNTAVFSKRVEQGYSTTEGTSGTGHGIDHPAAQITAPATPEAAAAEGLGTGLKPCFEPILVFRKPLEGTVADTVLKYGTGALNIDACRVKHSDPKDFEKHKAGVEAIKARGGSMDHSWKNSSDLSGANDVTNAGRWPSNLVLSHHPDCKLVGTKKAPSSSGPVVSTTAALGIMNDDGWQPKPTYHPGYRDENGTETVDNWECVPDCPVAGLNEQSGITKSGAMKREVPAYKGTSVTKFIRGRSGPSNQHGDSGPASRFFPQFEGQEQADFPFLYTPKASKKDKEGWASGFDLYRLRQDLTEEELAYVLSELTAAGVTVSNGENYVIENENQDDECEEWEDE